MNARIFSFSSMLVAASLLLLAASGCASAQTEPRPVTEVSPAVTARGETVYFGSVFPLHAKDASPTYVYERRVEERAGDMVSTHVTRDPSGAVALAESATHTADYALAEYTLHANQLGQTGTVRVEKDQVVFHLVDGKEDTSKVEVTTEPVVVGPTLVGHIFRHLEELRSGKVLGVRMAVLDRLETIGFDLRSVAAEPGRTRVRMTASSFVYGLMIDPIDFTFDTASGNLVRLEGRVPPKVRADGAWRDFDARVDYRFVAASYR